MQSIFPKSSDFLNLLTFSTHACHVKSIWLAKSLKLIAFLSQTPVRVAHVLKQDFEKSHSRIWWAAGVQKARTICGILGLLQVSYVFLRLIEHDRYLGRCFSHSCGKHALNFARHDMKFCPESFILPDLWNTVLMLKIFIALSLIATVLLFCI